MNAGIMKLDQLSGHMVHSLRLADGQQESTTLDPGAEGRLPFLGRELEILEIARGILQRIPQELDFAVATQAPTGLYQTVAEEGSGELAAAASLMWCTTSESNLTPWRFRRASLQASKPARVVKGIAWPHLRQSTMPCST